VEKAKREDENLAFSYYFLPAFEEQSFNIFRDIQHWWDFPGGV
jgi:hypothetical protein